MSYFIYIICIFILSISCSVNDKIESENIINNSIILNIEPNTLAIHSRTTELGDNTLNENKIDNVHIFFFSNNATDEQSCFRHEFLDNLSFQGSGTLSKQLVTSRDIFTPNTTYDIYTLANLPSNITISSSMTLGDLKSLHTITPITGNNTQNSFIMDGMSSMVMNPTNNTSTINIDMSMQRALSKIRIKFIVDPNSSIGTATTAHVSLQNFAEIGSILSNNPYPLTNADYNNSTFSINDISETFTFYSYENRWSDDDSNETYLIVNIPLTNQTSNYYRLPINKFADSDITGRIERNMIYDISAYIDYIGSTTTNGLVEINHNCMITDWTTNGIVLNLTNQHYLNISEDNIIMPNISSFVLNYVADLPINVTNITANCTKYDTNGNPNTVNYYNGDAEFPEFTIDEMLNTITINSSIPTNYVPKYINFTVTNNQALSVNATIIQYPAIYVSARTSTGNVKPFWYTGGSNLNLFTVNTMVPSSDGSYLLGDPTNGLELTDSTSMGNRIISPQFIVASQYGIYDQVTYEFAQKRCYEYGEDIYRSGWRLPTKAEMEIINRIQDDPNSAIEALLAGSKYWTAYKYGYYDFNNNTFTTTNHDEKAYVRPVYDLYKHETKK